MDIKTKRHLQTHTQHPATTHTSATDAGGGGGKRRPRPISNPRESLTGSLGSKWVRCSLGSLARFAHSCAGRGRGGVPLWGSLLVLATPPGITVFGGLVVVFLVFGGVFGVCVCVL